jgi:hypothetical protein
MVRRKKSKSRRRTRKTTNVLNLAQSVILGNAVTNTLFNTNMFEFVTGRIDGAYTPGAISQSSQITLPELLGAGMGQAVSGGLQVPGAAPITTGYGGVSGLQGNFGDVVMDNIKTNAVSGLTTMVVVPIAFNVISKLASKPRREFNKLARNIGLPVSM